ncbi:MAG: tripartite tricarboxylate transporter substrate binding protein [Gammaproteobacteria bacterium]|nr:tripartite tricarboxylate transporter substrate binding protein [Gammaproteobacteria bacterium]
MRWIISLLLSVFAVIGARAEDYPARPVKVIVPYAPGGVSDIAARIVGNKLSEIWKQQVVIENRPGGGGVVGTQAVAKAPADGYTLLAATVSEFAITQHLYAKFPLDPIKDFAPITLLSDTPLMFAAHISAPFNTVGEMIAYAKSQPGGLAFASPGNGTLNHLTGERFAFETHVKMLHVPYKGGGPAGAAIASGEVPVGVVAASSAITFIKGGRVKAIAVTMAKRIPLGPEWPTVVESGVPGFEASNWVAMVAPAGTAKDIIAKISADTNRALKLADVRERFAGVGAEPVGSTPEELGARIRSDSERYGKIARQLNIKLD